MRDYYIRVSATSIIYRGADDIARTLWMAHSFAGIRNLLELTGELSIDKMMPHSNPKKLDGGYTMFGALHVRFLVSTTRHRS